MIRKIDLEALKSRQLSFGKRKYETTRRDLDIVSVLGREEGYIVKYIPTSEGVPEGEAR